MIDRLRQSEENSQSLIRPIKSLYGLHKFGLILQSVCEYGLARGSRLTEVLKQDQYVPMAIEEQVTVLFTGVRGYLDTIEVGDITRFESQFVSEIRSKGKDILKSIREEGEISDATEKKLAKFCEDFVKTFA